MVSPLFAWLTGFSRPEWADLAIIPIAMGVYALLCALFTDMMFRFMGWCLTHTFWRLRAHGLDRMPKTGPVLLISNHVTFLDWLFIWAASPRRVRFLASASHWNNPLAAILLNLAKTIPIDDKKRGPRGLRSAFEKCIEALNRGEVICVFPEGQLTRNGSLLPFRRGYELIVKFMDQPVPIMPVVTDGLWGSIFSYRGGLAFWKWPRQVPYPVAVMFGELLPSTANVREVRLAIQKTLAECGRIEADYLLPVHRSFVRHAARHPLRKCQIDTSGDAVRLLNYGRVYAGAACLANWLRPRVRESNFVGVWLPTSTGSALVNIALAFLGKTSVNLNYTAGNDATKAAIAQTGLRVVLTSKRFLGRMPLEVPEGIEVIHLEDALGQISKWQRLRAYLSVLLLPGWWLDRVVLRLGKHRMDETLTVIFSSGSTGEPKGVMLSHRNVAGNIASFVKAIDLHPRDIMHSVLPFFHSFGYTVTLWGPTQVGAAALYHPDPRQSKEIGEQCKTHQTTLLLSTATFLRFYLRRCEPDDFKTLRMLVCGAEKLPVALAEEFAAKFGILPLEGYGCTELSPVVSVNIPDITNCGVKQIGTKMGSVGQALPGVAGRIVHPESSEILPPGEEGMLEVSGANVMAGYLHKPELTARVIRDGWYTTGDIGHIDEDGFIFLTGRLSRFAKIAGEMVPLERIEEQLHLVLGSNDRMLAVTAVPDDKRGERLVVLYLPTMILPVRELCDQLSKHGLPNLWQPDARDFHAVPEFPVLGSGKLDLRQVQVLAKTIVAGK